MGIRNDFRYGNHSRRHVDAMLIGNFGSNHVVEYADVQSGEEHPRWYLLLVSCTCFDSSS